MLPLNGRTTENKIIFALYGNSEANIKVPSLRIYSKLTFKGGRMNLVE